MDLFAPLKEAGFTYKLYGRRLERLGIRTFNDLLLHIPNRYDDLSVITKISCLVPGENATVQGKVIEAKNIYTRRFKIQKVKLKDDTGEIECVWFNQTYIIKSLSPGDLLNVSGKIDRIGKTTSIKVNSYETLVEGKTAVHTGRLVPIYPQTKGLSSKWIRNRIKEIFEKEPVFEDFLPQDMILRNNLLPLPLALKTIHYPNTLIEADKARQRLAFDELFLLQLGGKVRREIWENQKQETTHKFEISKYKKQVDSFINSLPFKLTKAQKRAVKEIFEDLSSNKAMNRMLEGEVGSGKTIVAACAIYLAYLNGFVSVFMSPTEILANQHFATIEKLLGPLGITVGLFTKNTKSTKKNFDVAIGTHSLLNEKIKFKNLGLAIIDEQQRFGVEQRAILRKKGYNPHFLSMTATPIPRTVFLTVYGDLNLSYLDEMPKGRKLVKTWLVPNEKRAPGYEWLKKKIDEKDKQGIGNQIFIVCPFIEESESMTTVKAAIKEYEFLKNEVFKKYKTGLIHGKLKAMEKQKVLEDFRKGELDVLVATPVVEVGIDIPNATIILIEAAERFGLAQLHQLRGRVGRGEKESFCLLFTESKNDKSLERLKSLEKIHIGAELAELDLKTRGPGEIYGKMQHGVLNLKVASFSDFSLIEKTKEEAEKILPNISKYPKLEKQLEQYKTLRISAD